MEPAATSSTCSGDPIQTFVFFDLETTGLPGPGSRPRIVELSMVAVHRNNLLSPCLANTPRVLDKLTLCVNPMKPINPDGSSITGLYNDSVYWQKDLDDNFVSLIQLFLKRHEPPMCLVAHNGHRFDFPLFRSELACIERALPDDILCVDSLLMFYDLDGVRSTEPTRTVLQRKPSKKYEEGISDACDLEDRIAMTNGGLQNENRTLPQATPSKAAVSCGPSVGDGDLSSISAINHANETGALNQDCRKKKQKTFHHARRKLEYSNHGNSTGSSGVEDFNCNVVEAPREQRTGSPAGPPLSDDPLLGTSHADNNAKHKVVKRLFDTSSESAPSTMENITTDSNLDHSDSEESSSDTIPVIGDNEAETMSTLQQMSTFIFSESSNASSRSGELSTKNTNEMSDGTFDSQKTVYYSIMEKTASGSKPCSLPDSPTVLDQHVESYWDAHHLAANGPSDSELLKMNLEGNGAKTETLVDSQTSLTDSVLAQVEIPSANDIAADEVHAIAERSASDVTSSERKEEVHVKNREHMSHGDVNEKLLVSNPSDLLSPTNNHQNGDRNGTLQNQHDGSPCAEVLPSTPKCLSPESKAFRAETEQKLVLLGSQAPRKDSSKQPAVPNRPRLSYKLIHLHHRILGYDPPLCHNAEDDSMSLLRIFHKKALSTLPWADSHAVPFGSIDFMYAPRPKRVIPEGMFPHQI